MLTQTTVICIKKDDDDNDDGVDDDATGTGIGVVISQLYFKELVFR